MLLLLLTLLQLPGSDVEPRAAEIADLVREAGGESTLMALRADPALWDEVLEGVATGRRAWLEVGRELRRHSSDDSSELLDMALAEALGPAAETVLEMADGSAWIVSDACGSLGFAERGASDGDSIARFLDERRDAVESVERPELAERRDACLEEIVRARQDFLGSGSSARR
jgi:hypothetical protein